MTRALLAIARDLRDDRALAEQICRACVAGLAISLHTASTLRVTLFASRPRGGESVVGDEATADPLEDLQFSLGEGACIEASRTGRPVLVPDMTDTADTSRWPDLRGRRDGGRRQGGLALPLQWGTVNLGLLGPRGPVPGPHQVPELWSVEVRTYVSTACQQTRRDLPTRTPGSGRHAGGGRPSPGRPASSPRSPSPS